MGVPVGIVLARRYRVLAQLGEGGMGSVYQVADLARPGVVCAVKELLDDGTATPEDVAWARKRFDDEIALMRRLSHPRIPGFVDSFIEGGHHYFVMEYIPGETLEQRQERVKAPLPERDVLRWMRDLCDVLTYMHSQKPPIIVRDLKPGNIMITPQDEVRLIDFGIARTYKPGQRSNTENLGTMTYASPEHLGQTQTDQRSDIYSLGATMYHLLTNSEPVPLETPAPGSLRRYAPTLSETTEWIVLRAMRIDPNKRFQSAAEMREAVVQSLTALDARASATSVAAPARAGRPAVPTRPVPVVLPRGAAATVVTPVARPAAATNAAAMPAANPTAGLVCPQCGYRNRRNAKFCARDGAVLRAGEAFVVAAPRTNAKAQAQSPRVAPQHALTAASQTMPVAPIGTTAQLHVERANESFAAGRFTQTTRLCEAAIAEGRATYDVFSLLGQSYRALGRRTEAARAFAQAAEARPTAETLLQEGLAEHEIGQAAQAQIALTRARALAPTNAEITYHLGLVCLDLGQLAQAEGELRDTLKLTPNDASALVALGRVSAARKQWQDAITLYTQAIAQAPGDASARLEMGRAYLALHRTNDALHALEAAAQLAPTSADVQTALGMCLHAVGRRTQAREALRRALALDPHATEAQQLLKQL